MEKIKCWVVYGDEWPEGVVFQSRTDALEWSKEERDSDNKAYTRVKYFTEVALEELPEVD